MDCRGKVMVNERKTILAPPGSWAKPLVELEVTGRVDMVLNCGVRVPLYNVKRLCGETLSVDGVCGPVRLTTSTHVTPERWTWGGYKKVKTYCDMYRSAMAMGKHQPPDATEEEKRIMAQLLMLEAMGVE